MSMNGPDNNIHPINDFTLLWLREKQPEMCADCARRHASIPTPCKECFWNGIKAGLNLAETGNYTSTGEIGIQIFEEPASTTSNPQDKSVPTTDIPYAQMDLRPFSDTQFLKLLELRRMHKTNITNEGTDQ